MSLSGGDRSGFYEWTRCGLTERAQRDLVLGTKICAFHAASGDRYGRPRLWKDWPEDGETVSEKRARRLMREESIQRQVPKRFKLTTNSDHADAIAPRRWPATSQPPADAEGQAKMALFDYLEVFYNQRRRHSTLGQISPAAFERRGGIGCGRCRPCGRTERAHEGLGNCTKRSFPRAPTAAIVHVCEEEFDLN